MLRLSPSGRSNKNLGRIPPLALVFFSISFLLQIVSVIQNNYSIAGDLAGLLTVGLGVFAATRSHLDTLLRTFYLSSVTFIVLGWLTEILLPSGVSFESGFGFNLLGRRLTGLSAHPNVIGLLCALLFALALIKYRNVLAATFSLVTMIFTENRGGLLAAVVILAIWAYSLEKRRHRVAALSSITVLAFAIFSLFGSLREGANDLTSGRLDIWSVCQSKISQGHAFGFGPNTIARIFGVDTVDWFRPFHCHNQFLDDAVNFGVVLACLNLVGLLGVIYINLRKKQNVLLGIFIVFLTAEIFESPIRLFASSGFLWINFCFYVFFFTSSRRSIELNQLSEK